MAPRIAAGRPRPAPGAALLMVMVAVALLALATLAPLRNERQAMQRERERELLFIGEQFRESIASYAAASPGGLRQFPKSLADLIEDKRFPFPRRHLRRLYLDPMTGRPDWVLLKEQGAIVGVASHSTRTPLKRSGFPLSDSNFADAATYADWKFDQRQSPAPATTVVDPSVPNSPPVTPPQAPSVSPPSANPGSDVRQACMRVFSNALNRCQLDPAGSAACRRQAGDALQACLKG